MMPIRPDPEPQHCENSLKKIYRMLNFNSIVATLEQTLNLFNTIFGSKLTFLEIGPTAYMDMNLNIDLFYCFPVSFMTL
jgi:hypothetical protein